MTFKKKMIGYQSLLLLVKGENTLNETACKCFYSQSKYQSHCFLYIHMISNKCSFFLLSSISMIKKMFFVHLLNKYLTTVEKSFGVRHFDSRITYPDNREGSSIHYYHIYKSAFNVSAPLPFRRK